MGMHPFLPEEVEVEDGDEEGNEEEQEKVALVVEQLVDAESVDLEDRGEENQKEVLEVDEDVVVEETGDVKWWRQGRLSGQDEEVEEGK